MKLRVTLLIVLPLLLCAGHFISAREARGASQALLGQAQAARAAMDAGDWASAQAQAQQLRAGWDEAHARLCRQSNNTFLVRCSFKNPAQQPFTISRQKHGKPVHKRINRVVVPAAPTPAAAAATGENGAASPSPSCFYTAPMSDGTTRSAPTVCDLIALLQQEGNLGAPCPKQTRTQTTSSTYDSYPA